MVDARGLPVAITLSAGQVSDKAAVEGLLALHPAPGDVVADRGYDARAVLDLIAARGGRGHIPTQRDRKVQRQVDPALYRQRNLVERFFSRLKHFRKVATRYGKTARNYLAAVLIVCSRLWMRNYERNLTHKGQLTSLPMRERGSKWGQVFQDRSADGIEPITADNFATVSMNDGFGECCFRAMASGEPLGLWREAHKLSSLARLTRLQSRLLLEHSGGTLAPITNASLADDHQL